MRIYDLCQAAGGKAIAFKMEYLVTGLRLRQRVLHGALIVVCVGFVLGLAGRAQAQTLNEALVATYSSNPTLRAARAELRAVNENVAQAVSNWRPDVEAIGSLGAKHTEVQDPVEKGESTIPLDASLRVTQPLYRGGRTLAATARARNQVQAQRARLKSVEQDVFFDGTTAYMDVWRDQSVLQLNFNNEQVLQRQLEASRDRFTVGEITRTDVAQSESRLAVATANRIAAAGDLAASRARFQRVVGTLPELLSAPPPLGGLPQSQDDVIRRSLQENPDVIAAGFDERAADRSVREIEGELYPEISLRGDLSHDDETSSRNSEFQSASLIAQITVPFYQQGAVASRVRAAKQTSSQRRLDVEAARRQAQDEAIQAWENLITAQAQIESFNASVRANEIALDGVRQENQVGARTILDILDAEQELLDSQVNLVRAQRDARVAGYQVLSAIGRLTARDLNLPVQIYDLEKDYNAVRGLWFGLQAPGVE